MKPPQQAALDELLALFQEWVDASIELRAAIRQRSRKVAGLNQDVHETLQSYLRAMELEAGRMGAVKPPSGKFDLKLEIEADMPAGIKPAPRETHLEMARRNVAGGRRIVAEQERRVENLRRDGYDTTRAAELLITERKILVEMQALLVHEGEAVRGK